MATTQSHSALTQPCFAGWIWSFTCIFSYSYPVGDSFGVGLWATPVFIPSILIIAQQRWLWAPSQWRWLQYSVFEANVFVAAGCWYLCRKCPGWWCLSFSSPCNPTSTEVPTQHGLVCAVHILLATCAFGAVLKRQQRPNRNVVPRVLKDLIWPDGTNLRKILTFHSVLQQERLIFFPPSFLC